ncbi:MAG: Rrf2 family transcriptional regulator [Hyphomicrobium sp.]
MGFKRMRLTKQTGHAIRILIDCALAGDDLVKVAALADRIDITQQNAFKIVHLLSRAGFISSVRGPNGGIRLAKPAESIRIGDIVSAMEETSVEVPGEPEKNSGQLSSLFGDALAAFISVLDAHTLAELAASHRPQPASVRKSAPPRTTRRPAARKA